MTTDNIIAALKIELRNASELVPYKNNARTHSQEQIEKIADSIKLYGMNNPITIDSNNIIVAGHGRFEALLHLGITKIPTIQLTHLTDEAKRRGYTLADNRLALDAGWDHDLLAAEFADLLDDGFDLMATGFTQDEIDALLNPAVEEGLTEPDAVPEPEENPVSVIGDIWVLGKHRIMCGDSTNPQHVEKLMNGKAPNLMVTDPPYGVKYDPSWRDQADLGIGERSRGLVANDDIVDWTDAYSLFTGNVSYVWHAGKYTHIVAKNLEDCGYEIVSQIIWAKQHFALSRGDYHWQHEPCWYAVKKGENHSWQGARDQATLWEIKNNNSFGNSEKEETWGHGTQKPLECMMRPILNNSKPGEYVYDPFGGSGTTLMASEKSGRRCLTMELEPKYADVIVRRWQEFSGKEAILEASNATFAEVKAKKIPINDDNYPIE